MRGGRFFWETGWVCTRKQRRRGAARCGAHGGESFTWCGWTSCMRVSALVHSKCVGHSALSCLHCCDRTPPALRCWAAPKTRAIRGGPLPYKSPHGSFPPFQSCHDNVTPEWGGGGGRRTGGGRGGRGPFTAEPSRPPRLPRPHGRPQPEDPLIAAGLTDDSECQLIHLLTPFPLGEAKEEVETKDFGAYVFCFRGFCFGGWEVVTDPHTYWVMAKLAGLLGPRQTAFDTGVGRHVFGTDRLR